MKPPVFHIHPLFTALYCSTAQPGDKYTISDTLVDCEKCKRNIAEYENIKTVFQEKE